jgi:hypothetical protein
MQHIQEIANSLTSIPSSEWNSLFSYLGGSTLVATLLQVAKHKLKFADMQKAIVLVLGLLSFLVAFANFLLQNTNSVNALPWLSHTTGLLMAGAVIMHRFIVSGAYYKTVEVLNRFSALLKEVEGEEKVKAELQATQDAVTKIPVSALTEETNLVQFQLP